MGCVYYTASSLDGYVADEQAGLEWLTSRQIDADGPFAIEPFLQTVGALVMGANTYEWIVEHHPGDWMYTQPSWVMTHRPQIIATEHPVTVFAGEAAALYPTLASAAGNKKVWVVGGGAVATQYVEAGLIDEMIVCYAPCSLGSGTPVLPVRSEWTLADCTRNADFVCAHWRKA